MRRAENEVRARLGVGQERDREREREKEKEMGCAGFSRNFREIMSEEMYLQMAGSYNEVEKTSAVKLRHVLDFTRALRAFEAG